MVEGRDLGQFVTDFTWYLRNLLLVKAGEQMEDVLEVSGDQLAVLREQAERMDDTVLMRYIRIFSDLARQLRYAAGKRVLVEIALIKLCRPQMEGGLFRSGTAGGLCGASPPGGDSCCGFPEQRRSRRRRGGTAAGETKKKKELPEAVPRRSPRWPGSGLRFWDRPQDFCAPPRQGHGYGFDNQELLLVVFLSPWAARTVPRHSPEYRGAG